MTSFRGLRVLPLALLAASCGVGGALALSGGGGGGGGGGSDKPPPPSVVVTAPAAGEEASNYVAFTYVLRDPQVREGDTGRGGGADDPRVRVRPQWSFAADPDTWFDMTEAEVPETDGTRTLPLGEHTFVWNTLPDLGGRQGRLRVRVRVEAEYEESAGIARRFRTRETAFQVDTRLCGTVFGEEVQPPVDIDTFPVDLRPDGDGFVVADFGANIVERVDSAGLVRRLLGFGLPGDNVTQSAPGVAAGVARLPTLTALDLDATGALHTTHGTKSYVTNLRSVSYELDGTVLAPFSVIRTGFFHPEGARGLRVHPSGALVSAVSESTGPGGTLATYLKAYNPQREGAILVGQTEVSPLRDEVLVEVGADTVAVAIGPEGEIYWVQRNTPQVSVLNTTDHDLTLGGATVTPGEVRVVAGTTTAGFSGDGGDATAAQFTIPGSIDVSADRALFVADTGNTRVRLVNLGTSDVTFAGTTVRPGEIDTVVGGGTGGVGSRARDLQLAIPNAVSLDANGNLLIADERSVVFVNGGTTAVTSYGKTAGAARTTRVYDASRRGGIPLAEPRAVHSSSPAEVFFTDRATVRVMNLERDARVYGGEATAPGGTGIVAGGAVPGFSGDGGSARSAAFSFPSGLARQGRLRLFVADSGNHRIRLVNLGDPRLPGGDSDTYLGALLAPGNVTTVVGGGATALVNDGDGLPATSASLQGPLGVAVAPDGLLWLVDTGHHRVRVVNPGSAPVTVAGRTVAPGTIESILGDGVAGFTADGPGPWRVSEPSAIVIDPEGVVYWADRGNARIRALNPTAAAVARAGITIPPNEVRTLVGNGTRGHGGDGGDGPSAEVDSPRGLFVQARLDNSPVALYFSDESENVVRALNLSSTDDLALQIDPDGRVLVTIPAASVFTVAGGPNTPGFRNPPAFAGDGGTVGEVRFNAPFGIAVTVSGGVPAHFFVADRNNDRLRRFGPPPLVKTN